MSLRARVLAPLLALAALPAAAQDSVANGAQFGAWTVSCQALGKNQTACVLTQTLRRDTDNAFIAQMLAFWNADGSESFIGARVPTGVYLPTGFAVQGEKSEQATFLIWQNCTPEICEALRVIEGDMLSELDDQSETVLGQYQPRLDMEPVVFRFSMKGLIDGLEALHPDTR